MRAFVTTVFLATALVVSACGDGATERAATGGLAGGTAGLVVGGPVGAVAGAAGGATVGAATADD
jgi:hypothetical protein